MDSATSEPRRIDGPLPCVKCLYDLAGLMSDQKCPECGTEIARTLESLEPLAVMSGTELKLLRRSLLLIALPMIAGTVWIAAGQTLLVVLWLNWGYMSTAQVLSILLPATIVGSAFTIASFIGWRMLAKCLRPRGVLSSTAQRRLSALASTFVALYMMFGAVHCFRTVQGVPSGSLAVGQGAVVVLTLLVWLLRTYTGFSPIRDLGHQCHSPRLRKTISVLRVTAVPCVAVVLAYFLYDEAIGPNATRLRSLEVVSMVAFLCLFGCVLALGTTALLVRRRLSPFAAAAAQREFAKSLSAPATQDTLAI